MKSLSIVVLVAMMFIATSSVVLACDPRQGCVPPSYTPPVYTNPTNSIGVEVQYAVERTTYDANYAATHVQHAYGQAQSLAEQAWAGVQRYPYGW